MPPPDRIQVPRTEWEEMRGEIHELRTAVDALVVAVKGNDLGTSGLQPRLAAAEKWIEDARLRLALIAAGVAGGATTAAEAVKAWFISGGHER